MITDRSGTPRSTRWRRCEPRYNLFHLILDFFNMLYRIKKDQQFAGKNIGGYLFDSRPVSELGFEPESCRFTAIQAVNLEPGATLHGGMNDAHRRPGLSLAGGCPSSCMIPGGVRGWRHRGEQA